MSRDDSPRMVCSRKEFPPVTSRPMKVPRGAQPHTSIVTSGSGSHPTLSNSRENADFGRGLPSVLTPWLRSVGPSNIRDTSSLSPLRPRTPEKSKQHSPPHIRGGMCSGLAAPSHLEVPARLLRARNFQRPPPCRNKQAPLCSAQRSDHRILDHHALGAARLGQQPSRHHATKELVSGEEEREPLSVRSKMAPTKPRNLTSGQILKVNFVHFHRQRLRRISEERGGRCRDSRQLSRPPRGPGQP